MRLTSISQIISHIFLIEDNKVNEVCDESAEKDKYEENMKKEIQTDGENEVRDESGENNDNVEKDKVESPEEVTQKDGENEVRDESGENDDNVESHQVESQKEVIQPDGKPKVKLEEQWWKVERYKATISVNEIIMISSDDEFDD